MDSTPPRRIARSSTKNTRTSAVPLLDTTIENSIPPVPKGRKRKHESDDGSLGERPPDELQLTEESAQPFKRLNKKDLEELNKQTGSPLSDHTMERKRSLSQRSSNTDLQPETASAASQRSSLSLADYRLRTLGRAKITIQHGGLPEDIQSQVGIIIQPQISDERKGELYAIADTLCAGFPNVLEAASREDDAVELVYRALASIHGEQFALRRKADWDPNLKPQIQRKFYNFNPLSTLENSRQETQDPSTQTNKRQQVEAPYVSPESSGANMPPPPPQALLKQEAFFVKTPRPDITLGFTHNAIATKLRMLGLQELDAVEFLQDLQDNQNLCFSPTQSALRILFPSTVVEGKSYATGKTIYEAQNQAAVSGSCMLNLQYKLSDLTDRVSPGSHRHKIPLAFTICTEGPILELWVHYCTSVENARFWNMGIIHACHASIPRMVREFFVAVEGVMRWASSEFLDDITKQLALIWKAVQTSALLSSE